MTPNECLTAQSRSDTAGYRLHGSRRIASWRQFTRRGRWIPASSTPRRARGSANPPHSTTAAGRGGIAVDAMMAPGPPRRLRALRGKTWFDGISLGAWTPRRLTEQSTSTSVQGSSIAHQPPRFHPQDGPDKSTNIWLRMAPIARMYWNALCPRAAPSEAFHPRRSAPSVATVVVCIGRFSDSCARVRLRRRVLVAVRRCHWIVGSIGTIGSGCQIGRPTLELTRVPVNHD